LSIVTIPPKMFNNRTSNSNERGSSTDRKVRKQWLLDTFGNGKIAFCGFHGCGVELDFNTITVDRFPVPGCEGGRYVRGNIRPACLKCNTADGGKLGNKRKKEKQKCTTK
jgi:hypothetical protein